MERGVVGEGVGDEAAAEGDERRLNGKTRSLTDEDLDELRGSIDLGFGFSEEEGGQDLCDTLPALNLYFAVNRQLSDPKIQLSWSITNSSSGVSAQSLRLMDLLIGWNVTFSVAGDSPQHVKTRLRHWAQAVACSLRQSC
ncbi:hypothetical protein MUK42_19525 [Musa troglodytarum]|uniref:Uncharacterized protein n=1 Tax=Musa troglodytarum TaxID=320322 RepID=A0A9E7G4F5_9LILI|nr:hypothetical protein MUK42_19525 [Musa troglodytarum]